jgi:signal transduction histidine kinase
MRRFSNANHLLSQLLVLGTGTTLTLMAMFWSAQGDRVKRDYEFRRQTRNLTTTLESTTNRYTDLLLSISDLYHASPEPVNAETFRQFVQRSVHTYPGIQALEWAPLVSEEGRLGYEKILQQSANNPNLGIMERDSQGNLKVAQIRPFYVPVTYLEPLQYNEVALGYDLASESTRFTALDQAFRTGLPTATGRLQLVQETLPLQYSFLLFVPIYKSSLFQQNYNTNLDIHLAHSQGSVTAWPVHQSSFLQDCMNIIHHDFQSLENTSRLHGYLIGVFRIAEVLEASLKDINHNLSFYVLDQTADTPEKILGFYDADKKKLMIPEVNTTVLAETLEAQCSTVDNCQQSFQLGQRTWQLIFVEPPQSLLSWNVWAVGAIGSLTTCILWVLVSHWQKELQQAHEMSHLKMRLFSMASHELRTPLSVITLSSQSLLLQADRLTAPEQKRRVERIQDAAQRLGQLVNDLLTLARAEAGKLEVDRSIVNLNLFLEIILDSIPLKPGQMVTVHKADEIDLIYTDSKLLTSILTNLITNSSKYSGEGTVISVEISRLDEFLNIQIQDQGIGIPLSEQHQVLEAFYRASNTSQAPGSGLGLAVVKTCIEHLQGSLEITKSSQEGTSINVKIPYID